MIRKHISSFSVLLLLSLNPFSLWGKNTVLRDYVFRADSTYKYQMKNTFTGNGYSVHVLEVFSQTWQSIEIVDRAHWQHWVNIIIPENLTQNKALLIISGGSNGGAPPSDIDEEIASIALMSNSVIIEVKMIPNEPVMFSDETFTRSEDAIIAYTWDKYLTTGDSDWPLQLPMVKSVVKSMDAVQDYFTNKLHQGDSVSEFVLIGGSKRGWTTWLTAAVDDRVHAIIPVVFDALNLVDSFKHHFGAYGFWSSAVRDYENAGIFNWFTEPEIYDLMDIVDPLNYKEHLTLPKFLIHSAGDEFFVPSSQFYFDQLLGTKYQRYVANTGHGMAEKIEDVLVSAVAFYQAVVNDYELPEFFWDIKEDGSIRFETETKPRTIKLWTATNENEFDFRYDTMGPIWEETILTETQNGVYNGSVPIPGSGYTAFFVEATYYTTPPYHFTFTTDVSFLPNALPHAATVTFTVSAKTEDPIYIQGDMTSKLPIEMYNDGLHGDGSADDGIWAVTLKHIIDGNYTYDIYTMSGTTPVIQNSFPLTFTVSNGVVTGTTDYQVGTVGVSSETVADKFNLHSVYPNPFNPKTIISYSVGDYSKTRIDVFNMNGRRIETLVNDWKTPGKYTIQWTGENYASGVYFITMVAGTYTKTQKAIFLK